MPWVCYAFGNVFFENGVLVDQSHQVQQLAGIKLFLFVLDLELFPHPQIAQVASSGFFKSTLSSSEAVQQQQYFPLLPQVFIFLYYILYIISYIISYILRR